VLKVGILDKEGNEVHLSDNLVIELMVDGVHLVPGQTMVPATLVGVGTCALVTPVTTSNTMEILVDMSLVPQLSIGGDSPLTWASSNTSITTSQLGISSVSGS